MTRPVSLGFLLGATYKPLIKSLSLNFLAGTTLDSRITFSRGTNATLVDSTGRVTWAPNNLAVRSEEFDNASWGKGATTVTGSAATAPNGTLTAEKIIPTAVSSEHYVRQTITIPTGSFITGSMYVKAAGYPSIRIRCLDNSIPANGFFGSLDTSTGISTGTNAGAGTFRSVSATNVGNDWWRLSVTGNAGATATTILFDIFVLAGNQSSATIFTGDATSGVFLWGAQFEVVTYQSAPSTYVQTVASAYYGPRLDFDPVTLASRGLLIEEQRTNLLLQSENFATTWAAVSTTVTTNTTVAPDGTTTSDTLTASTTGSYVSQAVTFTGDGSKVYSVFVKAGTSTVTRLVLRDTTASVNRGGVNLTWTAGVPAGVATEGTLQGIDAYPNGWYRVRMLATGVIAANVNQFRFSPDTAAGTGTTILWGAQTENGAFSTSYIPTGASTVTRAADIAVMSGTNFSSWYNQSEGTIVASVDTVVPTGSPPVLSFQGAPTSSVNRHQITVTTAFTATVDSSVTQSNIGTNTNLSPKLAYAYKANDFAACANGATVSTYTSGTVPLTLAYATLGKFDFGSAASLNGHIRSLDYYPVRWADAQLQSLTL